MLQRRELGLMFVGLRDCAFIAITGISRQRGQRVGE